MALRTQSEIVAKLEKEKGKDFFGFRSEVLFIHLDYDHAKPYLKDGTKPDGWMR